MYEKLIQALRCCADDNIPCAKCPRQAKCIEERSMNGLFPEAADAIEERCRQVDKFMEEAARLYAKLPRWIPVTERLPGTGEIVLVYGKKGGIYTAEHNRNAMWPGTFWKLNSKSHHCEPTHWMSLPEPPKGEKE